MKRILFFLLIALTAQLAKAQSVGIGTTAPNPKAALEINSTTKGLLIPSMTTLQRQAITTPPNGLMVYDTDFNEFYHRDNTTWRKLLNSLVWTPSPTRRWVYNFADSIGIGTSTPDERLEVNGNILSRNNLLADNNIIATGIVSGATITTPGNLSVSGTSFLNGNVTTNSDLIINNTTATMQLKSSSVNKGFFQLSGNNVRMGTNSGNTTGNLIIRMNGNDMVFVDETGVVSIGTQTDAAGYKLRLGGKMICEEVRVKLQANWPDYVFDKNHKLPSFSELENYILANHHLPFIPTASEIQKNGFELGDMQKRLLEKVEELTLYILQLHKEIELLKKANPSVK